MLGHRVLRIWMNDGNSLVLMWKETEQIFIPLRYFKVCDAQTPGLMCEKGWRGAKHKDETQNTVHVLTSFAAGKHSGYIKLELSLTDDMSFTNKNC